MSRVDDLLGLLGTLSQRDPSPALRERLSDLAHQRLNKEPEAASRVRRAGHGTLRWIMPVCAAALLVAIGLFVIFAAHVRQRESVQTNSAAKVSPAEISSGNEAHTVPTARPSKARLPKIHHPQPVLTRRAGAQQMTMRLPYSNSAIETGTDTTIRVAMSQSELLSLGFPVNATVQDGRVVAELTLGDDGLPRAISLPLPLEVIKEKR